jgi:hypothetical protein
MTYSAGTSGAPVSCKLAIAGATVPQIAALSGHSIAQVQKILDVYLPRRGEVALSAVVGYPEQARPPYGPAGQRGGWADLHRNRHAGVAGGSELACLTLTLTLTLRGEGVPPKPLESQACSNVVPDFVQVDESLARRIEI